jgi:hypothetical protein
MRAAHFFLMVGFIATRNYDGISENYVETEERTYSVVIDQVEAATLNAEDLQPLVLEEVGEDELAWGERLLVDLTTLNLGGNPLLGLTDSGSGNLDTDGIVTVLGKEKSIIATSTALWNESVISNSERSRCCGEGERSWRVIGGKRERVRKSSWNVTGARIGWVVTYGNQSTLLGMSLEDVELVFLGHEVLEGRGGTELVPGEEVAIVPKAAPLLAMFLDGAEK